ncbi:polysaccharide deacetylase family protein [Litorivicinus sp.]|nr:polysaccharide deacetylase family protein [Litorivicinus sp.]
MSNLTIVMYHYVRPINDSKFPGIKGLELDGFKRQLDYLKENFNIVSTEQVVDAARNSSSLPSDACWLTFDDGYKDHSKFVLPELLKRDLHGAFFPPRVAIEEDVVLDVNLIHHILSCADDVKQLVSSLNSHCLSNGISESNIDAYYEEYAVPNRFDNANTIFVKRMLQHVLPEHLRSSIAGNMFKEFVGLSAAEFSKELYMSVDEVKGLVNSGMYVGSHGSRHYWLNKISPEEQEKDIKQSLNFLEDVGAPTNDWVMCYPYGAYNDATLSLLKKYDASVGITTDARVANLEADNPFELPRLDTNDFPQ